MNTVRIGVVGLGNMGRFHASYLLERSVRGARLTAVADADRGRLAGYEVASFPRSEDLIRSGVADALIVATPHFFHTAIGIDALAHGLHVLVEKPIAVDVASARRLLAAHTDRSLVLAAMFNQRTLPQFRKIKSMVVDGQLGDIIRVQWTTTEWYRTDAYYHSSSWRATWRGEGGGILVNQCPHQIDLLQWLCGMPTKVRAVCRLGRHHPIEVEDEVAAYMEYPNGASGVFIASTGEYPGTNRLEIAGECGRVVVEGGQMIVDQNAVSSREFSRTSPDAFGVPQVTREVTRFSASQEGTHCAITQNFVDAILHGSPLIAPAEEGIHSVELANAMLYSSAIGETIELPLDADAYGGYLDSMIARSRLRQPKLSAAPVDIRSSFR